MKRSGMGPKPPGFIKIYEDLFGIYMGIIWDLYGIYLGFMWDLFGIYLGIYGDLQRFIWESSEMMWVNRDVAFEKVSMS